MWKEKATQVLASGPSTLTRAVAVVEWLEQVEFISEVVVAEERIYLLVKSQFIICYRYAWATALHVYSTRMCVGERPRTNTQAGITAAYGGYAYGTSLTQKVFMGSGGGGGARDDNCCALPGGGGNGGGIVMIFTPAFTGSGGRISSCGTKGQDAGHNINVRSGQQGGGGGGAGGSILLVTNFAGVPTNGAISIDLRGGVGGKESQLSYYAPGGKGSTGRFTWHKFQMSEGGPLYVR